MTDRQTGSVGLNVEIVPTRSRQVGSIGITVDLVPVATTTYPITGAVTQAQSLALASRRTVSLTSAITQAQVASVTTAVRHTYLATVSAVQAQILSLIATVVSGAPPPVPVAVKTQSPLAGMTISNYQDNPSITVHPTTPLPPIGTAIGGH